MKRMPSMNRRHFAVVALIGMLLQSGCGQHLRGDVVTFHDNPLPAGETIRVQPLDAGKRGSLEFEHYAAMVRERLRKIGYTPVEAGESSQLVAEMDYSVSDSDTMVRSFPRTYARYHFYFGRYHDPFYYGLYNDWEPEVYSYTVYHRTLRLNIRHSEPGGKTLFEGRVHSTGREQEIARVMPYLVTAMFNNFPGESGVTKIVTIDRDQ